MSQFEKAWENFTCHMNFDRIHKAMLALDWQWAFDSSVGLAVPNQAQIIHQAERLLKAAWMQLQKTPNFLDGDDASTFVGTGGLEATATYYSETKEVELELKFVVSDWDETFVYFRG